MAPGDTARLYHRLSSYGPARDYDPVPIDDPLVLQDFVPLDFERLPPPWKIYRPGLPVVQLPRDWPLVAVTATAALAGHRAPAPVVLDLPALARLLHLSAGVVRVLERWHGHQLPFRAAGSAGGRFPLEVYVSARAVDGLPDGVHWYDPLGHALVQVGPAADGGATSLVVTGVPWRTAWKYAERSFRHIYWDAGSMLAQTLALAGSAGLEPRLWTRFPDAEVSRLVGADAVQEFPVAMVALGEGDPAVLPRGDAARGELGPAPVEFPLVTLAQHAGDTDQLGDPWPTGAVLAEEPPVADDLDTVILRRGSTRSMDPSASVARATFEFSLRAALRGTRWPPFVAVHAVDGLEPGLYRWPDLDHPLRTGLLREELLWVCWDANLGRDAAFVVMGAVDLDRLDDRGYRETQLESGIVEGRLHLAAYALGIGASGMSFIDSEVEGLLGEPLAGLLFTCVGVPSYRNKPGGRPGEPVSIVMPTAGDTLARRPEWRRS